MRKDLFQDLYDLEKKHWWHIAKRNLCLKLLKAYKIKTKMILDIGCGAGKNVQTLSKLGKTYGIDSAPQAIYFCLKRGLKTVKLASSDDTGFKSLTFDLVTLLDVLEHVDEKRTLSEIHRILKNDGHIYISVPAYSWLWSNWDRILKHKRRYTKKSLKKILQENGFEVIKVSYVFSFLIIPVYVIRFIKSVLYKDNYVSDFKLSSNILNKVFLFISNIENFFVLNFGVPFGTSLICIAKKNYGIPKYY